MTNENPKTILVNHIVGPDGKVYTTAKTPVEMRISQLSVIAETLENYERRTVTIRQIIDFLKEILDTFPAMNRLETYLWSSFTRVLNFDDLSLMNDHILLSLKGCGVIDTHNVLIDSAYVEQPLIPIMIKFGEIVEKTLAEQTNTDQIDAAQEEVKEEQVPVVEGRESEHWSDSFSRLGAVVRAHRLVVLEMIYHIVCESDEKESVFDEVISKKIKALLETFKLRQDEQKESILAISSSIKHYYSRVLLFAQENGIESEVVRRIGEVYAVDNLTDLSAYDADADNEIKKIVFSALSAPRS